METPTLLSRLDEMSTLLESLVDGDERGDSHVRDVSNAELVTAVERLERVGRAIDAMRAQVAHEVDARTLKRAPEDPNDSLAHAYGFPSSVAMLKHLTLASGKTISRRIRIAKQCRTQLSLIGEPLPGTFEHVGAAFFGGDLHIDAAEIIVTELGKLPATVNHDHLDLAEQTLVAHATGKTRPNDENSEELADVPPFPAHADDLRVLTYGWTAALDQDGTLPREEQLGRRFFRIGETTNGLVPIRGAIAPEVAAKLGRVFDAINNPRATTQTSATGVRFVPADGNPDDEIIRDTRTNDQKRHDALATLINVAMKHSDMPQLGGEALSLTIQVTEDNLTNPRGTAWITDAHGQLSPLPSAAARHAACLGNVLTATQDATGRIITLETTARIFNAHQRKAIMLRDGGCIIPGCSQSAIWCEIHHVREWANGGKTHTDNGVLLCWHHHRYLDTHGWRIRMLDGVPQVKPPPWLDPQQRWRTARSVHRPPEIPARPPRHSRHAAAHQPSYSYS